MQIIKTNVQQIEHLVILLIFFGIIVILSGFEQMIVFLQRKIDKLIWGNTLVLQENTIIKSKEHTMYLFIKRLRDDILEWLIQDYKSSQLRKWLRWIKTKQKIIFSS